MPNFTTFYTTGLGAAIDSHCTRKKPTITIGLPSTGGTLIILLALVDADSRLRIVQVAILAVLVMVGCSALGRVMNETSLNVPEDAPLPGYGQHCDVPFMMIGDGKFPLKSYLMRP